MRFPSFGNKVYFCGTISVDYDYKHGCHENNIELLKLNFRDVKRRCGLHPLW